MTTTPVTLDEAKEQMSHLKSQLRTLSSETAVEPSEHVGAWDFYLKKKEPVNGETRGNGSKSAGCRIYQPNFTRVWLLHCQENRPRVISILVC